MEEGGRRRPQRPSTLANQQVRSSVSSLQPALPERRGGTRHGAGHGFSQGQQELGPGHQPPKLAGAFMPPTCSPLPGRAVGKRSCPPTVLGSALPCCRGGCPCNLNLRRFGNVNDGCHGLRGSSRARGARGTALWRVKGAEGLEPGRVVAPGLSWARGRLVISLPHWSHRGDCNSSQGRGLLGAAIQHRLRPRAAPRFPRSVAQPAGELGDPRHCCGPAGGHCPGARPRPRGQRRLPAEQLGATARSEPRPCGKTLHSAWEEGSLGSTPGVSVSHPPLQHRSFSRLAPEPGAVITAVPQPL